MELALLAAAITPGLRSILLFGADQLVLDAATDALEQMLSLATGRVVVRRYLGSAQQEDDLWIRPDLAAEEGRLSVALRPGVLAAGLDQAGIPLLVIPDLADLSLAAARGCVTLIDADVAHLERHGASVQWLPDACWLAACDRTVIGKVSPHLLDRFALRLDADTPLSAKERIADIRRLASGNLVHKQHLSKKTADQLAAALPRRPRIPPGTLDRVLDIGAAGKWSSPRREIALARLTLACARLEGPGMSVGRQHADRAAQLLNLPLPTVDDESAVPGAGAVETDSRAAQQTLDPADRPLSSSGDRSKDVPVATVHAGQAAVIADAQESLQDALLAELSGPYPEDNAVSERDVTALREAPMRSRSATVPRGSIVGVQQARSIHDIAFLNTVLAAAIWQPYRRAHAIDRADDNRLRLTPSDLRSYRRAPAAEQLLALVVDYTCLEGWDWSTPLLPFLRWAYVERAGLVLVRVGAEDSPIETRADRLTARNLLDPRLDVALDARPGRASPLAHGLILALQALRHGIQHGEGNVRRARLVVITDGRGNVPLELNNDLNVVGAVGRTGVEDALEVAASIRTMAAVDTFLVDPEPDAYPELVLDLAEALGAELVPGRSYGAEEMGR